MIAGRTMKISGNLKYSKFLPMKGDPGYFTKSGTVVRLLTCSNITITVLAINKRCDRDVFGDATLTTNERLAVTSSCSTTQTTK